jgi:tetratricopeptide (TPR) repeat protein
MMFDVFISYARADNHDGGISKAVSIVKKLYKKQTGADLNCFIDIDIIAGMDDWRHRILGSLRDSHLLISFLSPCYMSSEYCIWEVTEYLKYESARAVAGEGIAPIYYSTILEVDNDSQTTKRPPWLSALLRRNYFDLREWHKKECLDPDLFESIEPTYRIAQALNHRINRLRIAQSSPSNVPQHNSAFVNREMKMQRLHELAGLGLPGKITVIQGLPGIGKTSLAIQYSYTYAHYYAGGRWLIRCTGKHALAQAIIQLTGIFMSSADQYPEDDTEYRSMMILRNLEHASLRSQNGGDVHKENISVKSNRVLLILDNVEDPRLLSPDQTDCLTTRDWLHIIVTSQIDPFALGYNPLLHSLINIDELSHESCLALLEQSQQNGVFASVDERIAAEDLVVILGHFTLAVEIVAAYLSERQDLISCRGMLKRLQTEGFKGINSLSQQTKRKITHGEQSIGETLTPLLETLTKEQSAVLHIAAYLPSDAIPLPWLRKIMGEDYPLLLHDSEPGYEDPWLSLINSLIGLRLLQVVEVNTETNLPRILRMPRLLQSVLRSQINDSLSLSIASRLAVYFFGRVTSFLVHKNLGPLRWEINCLVEISDLWVKDSAWWNNAYLVSSHVPAGSTTFHSKLLNVGNFLMEVAGAPKPAEDFYCLADDYANENAVEDSDLHAECQYRLANLLYQRGALPESKVHVQRALTFYNTHEASNSPSSLECKHLLGKIYYSNDQYQKAFQVHQEVALEASRLGLTDLEIDCYQSMASSCEVILQLEDAFKYCEKALAKSISVNGVSHKRTGELLNLIGQMYRDESRLEEAISLFQKSCVILEERLGPRHWETINANNNLATALIETGRLEDAECILRHISAETIKLQGRLSADYVVIAGNYGLVLALRGNTNAGLELLGQCVKIAETIISNRQSKNDSLLADALYRYAQGLRSAKLLVSASNEFTRAANIWRSCFGELDNRARKALLEACDCSTSTDR